MDKIKYVYIFATRVPVYALLFWREKTLKKKNFRCLQILVSSHILVSHAEQQRQGVIY